MQQGTKFLILLSELPVALFGIFSGLSVHVRAKNAKEEELRAEFDLTRKPHLIDAKRAFRWAVAKMISAYAFLILALSYMDAIF